MGILSFDTESLEVLAPDDGRTGDIFSRLGYGISEAIADLVDNSVDARAGNVHVRFVRGTEGVHSVIIADDGEGMNEDTLREAMRFGSRSTKSGKQLGKYGIGLKSASLSQADTVTVLSRQGNSMLGRRWTLENVKKDWTCQILKSSDVRSAFGTAFGEFRIKKSGTIVIWERLEHLQALPNNVDRVLERTTKAMAIELGIRFHRFLEDQRLLIGIDQQFGLEEPTGIPLYVTPLNPFSYDTSGHADYPAHLALELHGVPVVAECHIWPPKSKSPGYRLGGGKVALRQGFYFYRNDRVIQGGGWNGIKPDDGEPHLSLARVKIDLPSKLDSMFKLDVTKSHLDPSPQFTSALQNAVSPNGKTYEKFIAHAIGTYRRQKKKEAARFAVIPGAGISPKGQRAIATILTEKGAERPTRISFKWAKLDFDEIFRADAVNATILLNLKYRKALAEGTSDDAPVLKVALMFLLQEELEKAFATKKSLDWMQRVNQSLLASLKE